MNKELQDKLFAKYPKIFRQKDLSMQETCMCWGISVGDGWYNLLDQLCGSIQSRVDNPRDLPKYRFVTEILNWPIAKINNGLYRLNRWCNGEFKRKIGCKVYKQGEYEKRRAKWLVNLANKLPHVPYLWKKGFVYQVEATQVKEKFGGLRFYYSGGNDEISAIISFAEQLCDNICEECGRFDDTVGTTSGWITTICKECVEKNPRYKDREWKTNVDWRKYYKELEELGDSLKKDNEVLKI
jgi:hypothetical protein